MKRFLFILAAVAALAAVSCDKENKALTAEFYQNRYTIYAQSTLNVTVTLSHAASDEIKIPIMVSGDAVKNVDFTLSGDYAVFAPGETETVLTVTDLGLTPEKSITLTLGAAKGVKIGTKYVTIISLDDKETLIYAFEPSEAVMLESYTVTLTLTGTVSGKDFKATEDLTIPLSATGEGAADIIAGPVTVKAGESKGTASIQLRDLNFSGDKLASLTVDPAEGRYIPGDKEALTLRVRGLQTPDKLLGTWSFDSVYDLEELELWFMEYEDDPDELPTHNEGFTLTFAKEGNDVVLTPGTTGDFTKFFRKAKVTLSTPVNMTAGGIKLGAHSTQENNMFIAEAGEPYQQNTYYLLDKANLAFSADTEEIGSARIIFRITPAGDLCVEFREYTNADEFGAMWWDGGAKLDPDMFGFASLFKKVE